MGLNVADVKNYSTFERDTIEIAEDIGFKYVDRFDYALGHNTTTLKQNQFLFLRRYEIRH